MALSDPGILEYMERDSSQLTWENASDFVRQMLILIEEEANMWELPLQVTDATVEGEPAIHGPWRPEDCKELLLVWFDAGLLDCIAVARGTGRDGEVSMYEYDFEWSRRARLVRNFYVLAKEDARALIEDTDEWRAGGVGWPVQICESAAAQSLTTQQWLDKIAMSNPSLVFSD